MAMTDVTFKVGDKVRLRPGEEIPLQHGKVYTVSCIDEDGPGQCIGVDDDEKVHWFSFRFELVEEAPVAAQKFQQGDLVRFLKSYERLLTEGAEWFVERVIDDPTAQGGQIIDIMGQKISPVDLELVRRRGEPEPPPTPTFKIGDRVRFTDAVTEMGWWFKAGWTGVIVEDGCMGYQYVVKVDPGFNDKTADEYNAYVSSEHIEHLEEDMPKPKFKPGDRVQAIQDSGSGAYFKGHIYVVRECTGSGDSGTVLTELDSKGSAINGWNAKFFELAEDQPSLNGKAESVARALCRHDISKRWDGEKLEALIEQRWPEYVQAAEVAIGAMTP